MLITYQCFTIIITSTVLYCTVPLLDNKNSLIPRTKSAPHCIVKKHRQSFSPLNDPQFTFRDTAIHN